METNTKILRLIRKQQRRDRQRIFRVVEYLDYSAVFEKCPVEVVEGYTVSDVESYDIFASFVFQNVSGKRIRTLNIQLLCSPKIGFSVLKIPFTYSFLSYTLGTRKMGDEPIRDKKLLADPDIAVGESFGEAIYIPIPEDYLTKIELEIVSVNYTDGTTEQVGLIAGKTFTRYSELDEEHKHVYHQVNIFTAAEEVFPTTVMPQKGENAWLCCCGHKNIKTLDKCEHCLRERDWQFENIEVNKLNETVKTIQKTEQAYFKPDKSDYPQEKYLENDAEILRKVKMYELAMKNVAERERQKAKLKNQFIPRLILYFAAAYLLYYLAAYFAGAYLK